MDDFIFNARTFIGASEKVKRELREYYNKHCIALVKPVRRYEMKPGDEWCSMFTSVIAHLSGFSNTFFPYEVSVREQVKIARTWGAYRKDVSNIAPGDLVIFDWLANGTYDHVGILVDVNDSHLFTVEGNKSNEVGQRKISRYSRAIRGYISLSDVPPSNPTTDLETLAKGVIQGVYGDGDERRVKLGSRYQEVQNVVNRILNQ